MIPLRVKVDQRTMAIKGYSAPPIALALLAPHHLIIQCHIQDTRLVGSYSSAEIQSVFSTAPVDWALGN